METITKTKSGLNAVIIGQYNNYAKAFLGRVEDPLRNNQMTTCSWKKNGQCVNRTRPELDIDKSNLSQLQNA